MTRSPRLAVIAALCIPAVAPHGGRTAAGGPATTVPDSPVDDLPPTPAGEQLAWVLSEGVTASAAEWTARLGPAMLDVVTPEAARDGHGVRGGTRRPGRVRNHRNRRAE